MSLPSQSQKGTARSSLTPRDISDHLQRLAAADAYAGELEEFNKLEEHKSALKKRGLPTRSMSAKTLTHSLEDLRQPSNRTRGDQMDDMKSLFQSLSRELKESINISMSEAASRIQESLESSLKEAINTSVAREMVTVNAAIESLTDRVEDLEADIITLAEERKLYFKTNEELTRQLFEQGKKIDDLENRTRRNNLKIRGIPPSIQQKDLKNYLQKLFARLLNIEDEETIRIDRAHRLGTKTYVSASHTPRDVICCLQSYEKKADITAVTRTMTSIKHEGAELQIYGDLSKRTSDRRRLLRPITEELRSKGIKYKWGFPLSIIVTKDGNNVMLEDGGPLEPFLTKLGLRSIHIEGWYYEVRTPDSAKMPLRCEAWKTKGGKQQDETSPKQHEQVLGKKQTTPASTNN